MQKKNSAWGGAHHIFTIAMAYPPEIELIVHHHIMFMFVIQHKYQSGQGIDKIFFNLHGMVTEGIREKNDAYSTRRNGYAVIDKNPDFKDVPAQ